MTERQSALDHPRSDDVKGRQEGGYEQDGCFGDRGYGDRGDFGDQGIGADSERETGQPAESRVSEDGGARDASGAESGGYADQADYGDLPRDA